MLLPSSEPPGQPAHWRSESDAPPPSSLRPVDDRLTADVALRRVTKGEHLLYEGDFHNARQLLTAMARRVAGSRTRRAASPGEAFLAERRERQREQETLSRVLVALDPGYKLQLRRAPSVQEACEQVWGSARGRPSVVALKTLLGIMGAAEWRKKGLAVPGLQGKLHPHYGVFMPTRNEYVGLLAGAPSPRGKRVFDVGTGTGVLGFILLQRGAESVVATDTDPRAVACARDNAARLRLSDRFSAEVRALFPEGRADLVVCNPPWIPEEPKNRVDRAVFDPEGRFLTGFLSGVGEHLKPGGEAYLLISNLAEILELRPPGALEEAFSSAALGVRWRRDAQAAHGKAKDPGDPLHAARSREVTSLYCLGPGAKR